MNKSLNKTGKQHLTGVSLVNLKIFLRNVGKANLNDVCISVSNVGNLFKLTLISYFYKELRITINYFYIYWFKIQK